MTLSSTLSDVVSTIRSYVARPLLYPLSYLSPRDESLWVFTADHSGRFAENTKYFYLHATAQDDDGVRPVWLSQSPEATAVLRRHGYDAYDEDSLRGRYLALRAGYVFLSHNIPFWPYVGGSEVIQFWHGNALKKIGYDNDEDASLIHQLYKRLAGRNWDRFVVSSGGQPLETFASAYRMDRQQMIVSGCPRNDMLFHDVEGFEVGLDTETYETVRNLAADSTLVTYMPTYRRGFWGEDGDALGEDRLDLDRLDDLLSEKDAYLLLKYHPHSPVDVDTDAYERVLTLPRSFDIYPILRHVDVLVTDYSSLYFDYLLLDRPIVFYAYDLESYERTRGLYFDYDEVTPGPKPKTPEELHDRLEAILDGEDGFEQHREEVREEFYRHVDGDSSRRMYEYVTGH